MSLAGQLAMLGPGTPGATSLVRIVVAAPAVEVRVLSDRLGVGGKLATATNAKGQPYAITAPAVELYDDLTSDHPELLPHLVDVLAARMADATPCPPGFWTWFTAAPG